MREEPLHLIRNSLERTDCRHGLTEKAPAFDSRRSATQGLGVGSEDASSGHKHLSASSRSCLSEDAHFGA